MTYIEKVWTVIAFCIFTGWAFIMSAATYGIFFKGRGSENYLDLYRKEHIRLHTEQNEKIGELVDLLKEKL